MHYHMQNEQYKKVIEVCELYGDQEACLWEQALGYFARKEENCKEYIAAVLKHIENKNLMPPLLGNDMWHPTPSLPCNKTPTQAKTRKTNRRRFQPRLVCSAFCRSGIREKKQWNWSLPFEVITCSIGESDVSHSSLVRKKDLQYQWDVWYVILVLSVWGSEGLAETPLVPWWRTRIQSTTRSFLCPSWSELSRHAPSRLFLEEVKLKENL